MNNRDFMVYVSFGVGIPHTKPLHSKHRFSPVFFRRTVGKHAEKEYFMRCLLFYLWVFVSSQEIRNDAFAFATASRFALYGGA